MSRTTLTNTATETPFDGALSTTSTTEKLKSTTATDTSFAGPLWLKKDVGALYAKGEVHTGPFSVPLLRMAGMDKLPAQESYSILDLCCGSGVTTSELQALFKEQNIQDKTNLICGDLSAGQLEYLDARIKQQGWKNTKTALMNAQVCC
jgi:SAM-dependent methyltransferase